MATLAKSPNYNNNRNYDPNNYNNNNIIDDQIKWRFYLFACKSSENSDIGKQTKSDNRPVQEDEAVLSHGSYPENEYEYFYTKWWTYMIRNRGERIIRYSNIIRIVETEY